MTRRRRMRREQDEVRTRTMEHVRAGEGVYFKAAVRESDPALDPQRGSRFPISDF